MIMPKERKTMKWMSGQNHCESDFYQFSTLLVYSYDSNNLVGCNIPRFCQILGEIFFAVVLLEMIGISQGFKTFEPI
jgi:hypothetical protein